MDWNTHNMQQPLAEWLTPVVLWGRTNAWVVSKLSITACRFHLISSSQDCGQQECCAVPLSAGRDFNIFFLRSKLWKYVLPIFDDFKMKTQFALSVSHLFLDREEEMGHHSSFWREDGKNHSLSGNECTPGETPSALAFHTCILSTVASVVRKMNLRPFWNLHLSKKKKKEGKKEKLNDAQHASPSK